MQSDWTVFVRGFGSQGSAEGQFDFPCGVTADLDGHVVVADADNHRLQVLTQEGLFVRKFGSKGECVCHERALSARRHIRQRFPARQLTSR